MSSDAGYVASVLLPDFSTTMASTNPLNIYTGPDSLKDYHNPDMQPLLPLVEIPDSLNPFKEYGARIHAKMMTILPAHNIKALPGDLGAFTL